RLELDLEAGLLAGLLDDHLGLLARRIDRGLEDKLQLPAVLRPDTVGALPPASLLQNPARLLDVEFPLGALGAVAARVVEEVAGGNGGTAIDVILDGLAVDQHADRTPHRGVGEQRMPALEARALALDLGPWIGVVELDMLDRGAFRDDDASLAALFEPPQDLV